MAVPQPRRKILLEEFLDKGRVLFARSSSPDRRYEISFDDEEEQLFVTFINRGYSRASYVYMPVNEGMARMCYLWASKGKWCWTYLRVRGSKTLHRVNYYKL